MKSVEEFESKIRSLSNRARYDDACVLSRYFLRAYPDLVVAAYYEAVFTAEKTEGYSKAENRMRYATAAKKLQRLLVRLRGVDSNLRTRIRNEYYWFSNQPYKQFLLGQEQVRLGYQRANYSQGVGAIGVAKEYARKGKIGLAMRWAKRSENAWKRFFKVDPNWYNSYLFYAQSVGLQGRTTEMNRAFRRASQISGKSINWAIIQEFKEEIESLVK